MLESNRQSLQVLEGGKATPPLAKRRTIDIDAEAAVVSNIMLDPSALIEVREWLLAEHFSSEAHRRIYEAVCDLSDAGAVIEIVAVASRLREGNRLAQVGGMAYLTEVLNAAPAVSPRHLRAHAQTVRDLAVLRQFAVFADRSASEVENGHTGVEVLLGEARAKLDELSRTVSRSEDSIRVDAVRERVVRELTNAAANAGAGARPTGFDRLDRLIAGLSEELTILGARPGMGKTALATGVAVNVARRGGGVYFASLETSEVPLFTRIVCAEAHVNVQRARLGSLNQTQWQHFLAAAKALEALPLWLDTTGSMSARDLWARCRRQQLELAREGRKLELVVVDYVQLLLAPRSKMPRHEAIAENVRTLKSMAQELKCTVLGLAQLNREVERRDDKRPQLADLRESGELEQCARTVMFLYRADYYARHDQPKTGTVEVIVAKQNNGPTGMVRLGFAEDSTGFFNLPEGAS